MQTFRSLTNLPVKRQVFFMMGMPKAPNAFKQGLAVLVLDSWAPDGLLTRRMDVADREREPAIAKNTAAQWLQPARGSVGSRLG